MVNKPGNIPSNFEILGFNSSLKIRICLQKLNIKEERLSLCAHPVSRSKNFVPSPPSISMQACLLLSRRLSHFTMLSPNPKNLKTALILSNFRHSIPRVPFLAFSK
jgi:hypothetical protein